MAGQDTLYPNLSPAHTFVVVPNRLDSRLTFDGHPPFPASVLIEAHRQASRPATTVSPGEASSPTSVGAGLLRWRCSDHRRADWHVDEVVLRGKGPVGLCDVLSNGGKEDVESPGFTWVLGVDWNHQYRRLESAVGTLQKVPSKGNWEPGNSPTTHDTSYPCGGTATGVKRPECPPYPHHP